MPRRVVADRPGPLRRPAGRHGGGGEHRYRQGRRRAGHGGLRAAPGCHQRRAQPSQTSGFTITPPTSASMPTWANVGNQGRVRACGPCGEVRDLGAARHRRAARCPRRGRRLRSGDQEAHPACRLRQRSPPKHELATSSTCRWPTSGSNAATSAATTVRASAFYQSSRWWYGQQEARPPGEMDMRTFGGFRQRLPGPRSGDQLELALDERGRFLSHCVAR